MLEARWRIFVSSPAEQRTDLFRESRDREIAKQYAPLGGGARLPSLASLTKDAVAAMPVRFSFRSFDRWLCLPDNRLADYLRPPLWHDCGARQIFLTSLLGGVIGTGPAATACAHPPDLHHFRGSFGGKDVIPLWRDAAGTQPNLPAGLPVVLAKEWGAHAPSRAVSRAPRETPGHPATPPIGKSVTASVAQKSSARARTTAREGACAPQDSQARAHAAEDFFAYTYAVLCAPGYVETFSEELTIPGPRLPVTRDAALAQRAIALGRRLLWLHTYGERFVPEGKKRGDIPVGTAKCVKGIPTAANEYPEEFSWEECGTGFPACGSGAVQAGKPVSHSGILRVGAGEFAPVPRAVWEFNVSGYEVVKSWLGFRMKARSGRKSSPLDEIRPAAWTAALTTELIELLWVLEATVAAQPELNALLAEILASPLFTAADFPAPAAAERNAPSDEPEHAQQELGV